MVAMVWVVDVEKEKGDMIYWELLEVGLAGKMMAT
jgi:hypothetical protein